MDCLEVTFVICSHPFGMEVKEKISIQFIDEIKMKLEGLIFR